MDTIHDGWQKNESIEESAAATTVELELDTMAVATLPSESVGLAEQVVQRMIAWRQEVLAEAKHDGWMSRRVANGWTLAKARHRSIRRRDMLIPYSDLPSSNREKDQRAVPD